MPNAHLSKTGSRPRRAFSLLELVIAVVIIGVLAAIAVPRLSRGASAASDSVLSADLTAMRRAIEYYSAEHEQTYPTTDVLRDALLRHSNIDGSVFGDRDVATGVIYGPYLVSIPALPVGANKGNDQICKGLGGAGGWVYDETTGAIIANCDDAETDANKKKYNTY